MIQFESRIEWDRIEFNWKTMALNVLLLKILCAKVSELKKVQYMNGTNWLTSESTLGEAFTLLESFHEFKIDLD